MSLHSGSGLPGSPISFRDSDEERNEQPAPAPRAAPRRTGNGRFSAPRHQADTDEGDEDYEPDDELVMVVAGAVPAKWGGNQDALLDAVSRVSRGLIKTQTAASLATNVCVFFTRKAPLRTVLPVQRTLKNGGQLLDEEGFITLLVQHGVSVDAVLAELKQRVAVPRRNSQPQARQPAPQQQAQPRAPQPQAQQQRAPPPPQQQQRAHAPPPQQRAPASAPPQRRAPAPPPQQQRAHAPPPQQGPAAAPPPPQRVLPPPHYAKELRALSYCAEMSECPDCNRAVVMRKAERDLLFWDPSHVEYTIRSGQPYLMCSSDVRLGLTGTNAVCRVFFTGNSSRLMKQYEERGGI